MAEKNPTTFDGAVIHGRSETVYLIEALALLAAIVIALLLWTWLGRKLGRGHLGGDRSITDHLLEQDSRRHPF